MTLLENINQIFSDVQPYIELFDIDLNTLKKQSGFNERKKRQKVYYALFRSADQKLCAVLPSFTPAQILEGYLQGCRIFQRRVGGYMAQYFDPIYVPTMKNEIATEHMYNCSLFLQVLVNQLGGDVKDLVFKCLSSNNVGLKLTAISACHQLHLIDSRSMIEELVSNENPEIAYLSKEVLARLR